MSEQKVTPWFPADVQPVRAGVYEIDFGGISPEYQYWNGFVWLYGHNSVGKTAKMDGYPVPIRFFRPWRGLAKKP